jgi:glutamate--cysteine ligase
MKSDQSNLIKIIKKLGLEKNMFQGNFGLEKENLRVDANGRLALTPHPEIFGNKLKNPYITTDFSESQVEMITPVFDTIEECYSFLDNLHNIISLEISGEYLWPQSMPPELPEDDKLIPIARYDESYDGKMAEVYREKLAEVYGRKKQLISGIHHNFSFKEDFFKKIYVEKQSDLSFKEFKNQIYLKISRNLFRYRWFLIYLLGASVGVHKSYGSRCPEKMTKKNDNYYSEYVTSFRNGICGYRNIKEYPVSYKSLKEYIEDIEKLIETGELESIKEYYSSVRLKAKDNKNVLESLKNEGIEYLELRLLDLNPLLKNGIDIDSLYMIHLIVLFCLFKDEKEADDIYDIASSNHKNSASMGRKEGLILLKSKKEEISLKKWGNEILDEITGIIEELGYREEYFKGIIDDAREKILTPEKTTSSHILNGIKEESFIGFHMKKAKEYFEISSKNEFKLTGYEDLELSTQVLLKEAIKRGIKFEILDRDENFIVLNNDLKKEYIKQATKTSLDSYSTVLVMENKLVTKKVLEENRIIVPKGGYYRNKIEAMNSMYIYKDKKIVIKPKSTNFGLGITIFKDGFSKDDFQKSIDMAFEHDTSVLIEEFVEGKEYRFFVIGDEVAGILHRVPANVTGDGVKNIRQLVEEKNNDPLRGKGYRTPLEKIALGESEKMFLNSQGKNFDFVPSLNEIVYLRENSNISTGGDSIDFTDLIPESYKDVAVDAAKAASAKICGVDMMIKNIEDACNDENYAIIELNFNPAIHIHCYPYKGENRKLGAKILDALGF